MRIASLLSSATEIVYELGIQESLVAISHECDYPAEALGLPRLSRSRFDPAGLSSGEIDQAVRRCMEEYGSVYEIDVARLRDVRPDVILTQAVCEVCAVPTGSVQEAVATLPHQPEILSLDAHTLDGILSTIQQVADVAGITERGRQTVAALRQRMEQVAARVLESEQPGPRVLALEWLDPPFIPGHWVPEMIEMAGGENLAGRAGERSLTADWDQLQGLDPDRLLLLPCGYDLQHARQDADRHRTSLEAAAGQAVASGGAWLGHGAYFSRSGPRVVGGIEALGQVFYPDLFPPTCSAGRVEIWP
jgi:iron complex transport system substrate-binding protein